MISTLLHPELYSASPNIARLIDLTISPEIDSLSTELSRQIQKRLIPTDDILTLIDEVALVAKNDIRENGHTAPQAIAFVDKHTAYRIKFPIPISAIEVSKLRAVYKCLGVSLCAQVVIFVSEFYLEDGKPAFGKPPSLSSQYGLYIHGSSVFGQIFTSSESIKADAGCIVFCPYERKIAREDDGPFGKFFDIKDEIEMVYVLEQMPQIMRHCNGLTEHAIAKNIATLTKVLN